ncbi:MAG: long-chain-fatty-acid--CoA ligase [Armatimonadetes bacterium]|nr:long-chain-fatty-acid--CoA ligase [Armatimonadota bacterium]
MDGVNYASLTPLAFLERTAAVFPDRTAVVYGERRHTYREFRDRVHRLAAALREAGVRKGDRVALLCPNTTPMLEAHFGVPLAGGVLVAINTRLTSREVQYILGHSEARLAIVDAELLPTVAPIRDALPALRRVIVDPLPGEAGSSGYPSNVPAPEGTYEALLAGAPAVEVEWPQFGELDPIAINYTSGTTGLPKGVMYSHRGATLNALGEVIETGLTRESVYLWTLPMFHCNGWCFPWGVTAAGATHLCLRKFDAGVVWKHLRDSNVTHLNGAPTVLVMLAWHPEATRLTRTVRVATGGAPPTPAILTRMSELGMDVTHLYGLTETFGPAVICEWRGEWSRLPGEQQAQIKARQGVGNVISQELRVVDPRGSDVPRDGLTLGEIALRGNNVMLGYYQDEIATRKAIPDGWFRTGDLGVMHSDGYIEIKDRAKDIILSGGENIASIEVERALCAHPAVLEAAVVAGPDPKWGEVPVAFVTLKAGADANEAELIAYAREHLAHFKTPKRIEFGELPKNATGKIQKFVLRDRARELLKEAS